MTTWARKVGGQFVDIVTIDPSTIFHPELATQFFVISDDEKEAAASKAEKPKKKGSR